MKNDILDQEGSIGVGTSYNVPPVNERCETLHVPSGLGDCNALQAPPSDRISAHVCVRKTQTFSRPTPLGAYGASIFAPSALMLILSPSKHENQTPPMVAGLFGVTASVDCRL